MTGGANAAFTQGAKEIEDLLLPDIVGRAVDLGAGFGMHALPLAQRGWDVLAIDSSDYLLNELRQRDTSNSIRTECDDLLNFPLYLEGPPNLVLCMTDTLLHLPNEDAVAGLLTDVAQALADDGRFIITLRDYSTTLRGTERFIPVRSSETQIATCFLEYEANRIIVHDILHSWTPDQNKWTQQISSFAKLRLSGSRIKEMLWHAGLHTEQVQQKSGMITLIARNRPNLS